VLLNQSLLFAHSHYHPCPINDFTFACWSVS